MNPETATRAHWSVIDPHLVWSSPQCSGGKGTDNEWVSHPSHLPSFYADSLGRAPASWGLVLTPCLLLLLLGLPHTVPLRSPSLLLHHALLRVKERAHYGVIPDPTWDFAAHISLNSSWPRESSQARLDVGSEQPDLGEDVPAHGRGGWTRWPSKVPSHPNRSMVHPPWGWRERGKQHCNGSQIKHTNTLGNAHYVVKDHFVSSLTRPLFYLIALNHFNK